MKKIIIDKKNSNQRLDKFLLKFFNNASKSFVYKMIRKKNIKLNDNKAFGNEILKTGDEIFVYMSDETIYKFQKPIVKIKSDKPLKILYEDENILICEKPVDILSQPQSKFDNDTILNRLYKLRGNSVSICNRLDRNTSGIIICGKNFLALQQINNLIANHFIEKYYLTIVVGKIAESGHIEGFITKNTLKNKSCINKNGIGKEIITEYRPIKFTNDFTLLEIKLITGKSHQIRVHMANINHPLLGDDVYGKSDKIFGLKGQALHARLLGFIHPTTKNYIEFKNEPPKYFIDLIEKLRRCK